MKLLKQQSRKEIGTRRRGSALLMVIMLGTFTMGLWAVTFRSTRDAIETEAFHNSAPYYEGRIIKALAFVGNMLENDKPQDSNYRFIYVGQDSRGRFYTVVELRKGRDGHYEAGARPALSRELQRYPRNPSSF